MKRFCLRALALTVLLGGCLPAAPPVSPTSTFNPAPTSTAAPTPFPALGPVGPYLLLYHRGNKNLTIIDVDRQGKEQIALPEQWYVYELRTSVSPDGKWLAYFTGSTEEPYDLALHLLSFSDKSNRTVANLIAPGFPENLEPVTKTVWLTEYDGECAADSLCKLSLVRSAFQWGIRSIAWSPDSTQLAFAAQIDGPSSDVYVYSLDGGILRRLTDDLPNVQTIEWSPDGAKVVYTNSLPGMIYIERSLHILDPAATSPQNPRAIYDGLFWGSQGWLSEDHYIIYGSGDGGPLINHIYAVNTDTEELKELWPDTAEFMVLNSQNESIVLSIVPWDPDTEVSQGIYRVELNGRNTKLSSEPHALVETGVGPDFVIYFRDGQYFEIGLGGKITPIGPGIYAPPFVSPDQKWMALFESETRFTLYSMDHRAIRSWTTESRLGTLKWQPNADGMLVVTLNYLGYLQIPDGEIRPIYDCGEPGCSILDFAWLP